MWCSLNPVPNNFVWPYTKDEVTSHCACKTVMKPTENWFPATLSHKTAGSYSQGIQKAPVIVVVARKLQSEYLHVRTHTVIGRVTWDAEGTFPVSLMLPNVAGNPFQKEWVVQVFLQFFPVLRYRFPPRLKAIGMISTDLYWRMLWNYRRVFHVNG